MKKFRTSLIIVFLNTPSSLCAADGEGSVSAKKPDIGLFGRLSSEAGYEHTQALDVGETSHAVLFLSQQHQWSFQDEAEAWRFNLQYRLIVDFVDNKNYEDVDSDNVDKLLAYAAKSWGSYKLGLGMQEVTWGENLLMPILDLVNPRDLTHSRGYYDPAAKNPSPMINLEWQSSEFNYQLIYVPLPLANKQPDEVGDFGISDKRDYKMGQDSEQGGRVGLILAGIDTKLYYWKHWPRVPSYRFNAFADDKDVIIDERQVESTAMTMSYAGFNWLARADLVHHNNYPATSVSAKVERSGLTQGIFGANWTTDGQQSFGAEFHFDLWEKGPEAFTDGAFVKESKDQKHFNWVGATANLNYFNYLIEPQLFYLRGINSEDEMIRAILLWNAAENITVTGEFQRTYAETSSPKLLLDEREILSARVTYSW